MDNDQNGTQASMVLRPVATQRQDGKEQMVENIIVLSGRDYRTTGKKKRRMRFKHMQSKISKQASGQASRQDIQRQFNRDWAVKVRD